ncbi:hypothetical protein ACTHGU_05370 [Chitinophagaceae bacterium MMS25-I14]
MKKHLLLALCACLSLSLHAQNSTEQPLTPKSKKKKHSVYFSWGYNMEWYTRSKVKVKQDDLGNNYTLEKVKGHDHKGWDQGLFQQQLTIPQYNYRIGYMFDEDRGWGVELNFDHTKFIIQDGQDVRVKGTLNHQSVDTTIRYSEANGFYYYLNNGANFFLINLVKRWNFYADKKENIRLSGIAKVGVGPVVPHVENSFFGKENDPHFQLGGWNTGVEGCLRATFFRWAYIEYSNKFDYARYSGLKIYEGKARQAFGTYEMILSLGVNIPPKRK